MSLCNNECGIYIRLDKDIKKQLKELCLKKDTSIKDFLQEFIKQSLKEEATSSYMNRHS